MSGFKENGSYVIPILNVPPSGNVSVGWKIAPVWNVRARKLVKSTKSRKQDIDFNNNRNHLSPNSIVIGIDKRVLDILQEWNKLHLNKTTRLITQNLPSHPPGFSNFHFLIKKKYWKF
jgi:hypothetical protein